MEPEGRLLESVKLEENGLTVFFFDQSRPVAGDRFQVRLLVYVPLEIERSYFDGHPDAEKNWRMCLNAFGSRIAFEKVNIRNFISKEDVREMLRKASDGFKKTGLSYLSKPDFARKFILKEFARWEKEKACRDAHLEAVQRISGK